MDTVGFVSDLPHALVDAFRSTLLDVVEASVLVHVRDISHPETKFQKEEVLRVLQSELCVPTALIDSMIEVNNKVDLLGPGGGAADEALHSIAVSATTGQGLDRLLAQLEEQIASTSGKATVKFKIPITDGEQLSWLCECI